jgi:DNA primase
VGREGSAAFAERLSSALPLSEYLAMQLREQADLKHADGRAKFVALARPMLAKIPPGVYLELLLARIAQDVGLSADRLRELLRADLDQATPAAAAPAARAAGGARRGARAVGAGRASLVTQAIQTLLHFPAAAAQIPAEVLHRLNDITEAEVGGIATLRELLLALKERPGRTGIQLLEQWRERPEHRRLEDLYDQPLLLEGAQAGAEFQGTLERLSAQVSAERQSRRYDELLRKVDAGNASAEERTEFQALNKRPAARPS